METKGGRILGGKLDKLRDEIGNYFGTANERAQGLNPEKVEKPEAFRLYEQINAMGTPLVQGGIRDQPHIFMMEYRICEDEAIIWNRILKASLKSEK